VQQTIVIERNGLGAKTLTFGLAAAVALLVFPYFPGLLGAGVLYVVAASLIDRLRLRRSRWMALVSVFTLFVILVLPGVWLLAELLAQIPDAARSVQESPAVQRVMRLQIGAVPLGSYLQQASSEIVAWSSRQTIAAIGGVMKATLNLVIALIGAYYLLTSADVLWDRVKASMPFGAATSELLRVRFYRVTEAMLLGVVLTGFAQGALVTIAFALIGFSHALFWGAVTAVVSILPMFGSALVWGPTVLVLLAQQRFGAAISLAALGIILVSNIDNALRLVVYRRVSQIHPMVTLVGAFAGVNAFGLAGLLLGPLVLSYALELFKVYRATAAPTLEVAA
jgi:predicted PurR-regulated permease PerM